LKFSSTLVRVYSGGTGLLPSSLQASDISCPIFSTNAVFFQAICRLVFVHQILNKIKKIHYIEFLVISTCLNYPISTR
jgi:hypothetical protein